MPILSDSSKLVYTIDGNDRIDISVPGTAAAAVLTLTIPAIAGKTAYLTGFIITGGGATAASLVTGTITGINGGTHSHIIAVPAGATAGITPITRDYNRPQPASAVNTAIVLSIPSFGAGNTAVAAIIRGYYS